MLNDFLNLPGVVVLGKEEQRKISGGQTCLFRLNGGRWQVSYHQFSSGEAGSAEANAFCVGMIEDNNMGVDSCSYDCSYDGFGQ